MSYSLKSFSLLALTFLVLAFSVPSLVAAERDFTDRDREINRGGSERSLDSIWMMRLCERLEGVMARIPGLPMPEFCDDAPPPPPNGEGMVMITEIMYDLPGSDANREWIEIWNGTDESVDLSNWTLFESDSDKNLTLAQGDATVPPGGFAVIVEDDAGFLGDWPDFAGTILDATTFSLLQDGETIAIKNGAGEIVDEVTYDPSVGAGGDGNSLQKVDGEWIAAEPTPGAENTASEE